MKNNFLFTRARLSPAGEQASEGCVWVLGIQYEIIIYIGKYDLQASEGWVWVLGMAPEVMQLVRSRAQSDHGRAV